MMKLLRISLLAFLASLGTPADVAAQDLAGYWQNDEQSAWIEINFENGIGTGTVRRNDNKPDAVGRILLKDVVRAETDPDSWQGQIFAQRLGEYKDAVITLPTPEQMQIVVRVGFMSRTVTWTRAEALPAD